MEESQEEEEEEEEEKEEEEEEEEEGERNILRVEGEAVARSGAAVGAVGSFLATPPIVVRHGRHGTFQTVHRTAPTANYNPPIRASIVKPTTTHIKSALN